MAREQALPVVSGASCVDGCACCTPAQVSASSDRRLRRWAWWLTALTIGWNSLEAVIATASGLIASSIALVGFGLDSIVEVSSALVIAWRLSRQGTDHAANERAERRAVRLIAVTFLAIAAYVTYDSLTKLLGIGEEPEHSAVGLILVALSWWSCPPLPGPSVTLPRAWGQWPSRLMPLRPNCARTCRPSCLSDLGPTACWAGGGWIPLQVCLLLPLPSRKDERHGPAVTCASVRQGGRAAPMENALKAAKRSARTPHAAVITSTALSHRAPLIHGQITRPASPAAITTIGSWSLNRQSRPRVTRPISAVGMS